MSALSKMHLVSDVVSGVVELPESYEEDLITVYQALSPVQWSAAKTAGQGQGVALLPGRPEEKLIQLKLSQRYAEMVARQWFVPVYGAGFVVRYQIEANWLARFPLGTVAYEEHREFQIPRDVVGLTQKVKQAILISVFRQGEGFSIPKGRALAIGGLCDRLVLV